MDGVGGENMLLYAGIALSAIVALAFLLWGRESSRRLPPGPWGLPLVGYLPFLGRRPEVTLHRLSRKYGKIIGVKFGSFFGVILNDYKVIREAFNRAEFLERPIENLPFKFLGPKFRGFPLTNGEEWMEDRRYSLHALRNLGMNKSTHVQHVSEEISQFLDLLSKQEARPVKCDALFTPSVSNNIVSLVFGKVLEYEHPERKLLDELLAKARETLNLTAIFLFMPWLTSILMALRIITVEKFLGAVLMVKEYVRKELEEHQKTYDPNNPRDYMDYYLSELEAKTFKYPVTVERLTTNTQALFGAGSGTTSTTLSWMMLALAKHPDIQDRIRTEVWTVAGRDEMPQMEHRPRMCYTDATVHELLRWKTIAPLGVNRRVSKDTMLEGYFIPKHSFVMPNLYAAHHDVEYWGDPENFRPERFLKDGSLIKHEAFMPFSVGRRSCPGEGLAMIEAFLYTSAIVQKFRVCFPPGVDPILDGRTTLAYDPDYKTVCFIPLARAS